MNTTRTIKFLRPGRLRLRRLAPADLPALAWLGRQPAERLCTLEPFTAAEPLAQLIEQAPQAQVAIERDHRLIGALAACPGTWSPAAPAQPWKELAGSVEAAALDDDGRVLRGCGALWLDVLSSKEIHRVLTVGRKAVVQQLGADETVSVVHAETWEVWRAKMTPEAFLQQVHSGRLGDQVIGPYLENGWVLRGYWETEQRLEVVLRWVNRRR